MGCQADPEIVISVNDDEAAAAAGGCQNVKKI